MPLANEFFGFEHVGSRAQEELWFTSKNSARMGGPSNGGLMKIALAVVLFTLVALPLLARGQEAGTTSRWGGFVLERLEAFVMFHTSGQSYLGLPLTPAKDVVQNFPCAVISYFPSEVFEGEAISGFQVWRQNYGAHAGATEVVAVSAPAQSVPTGWQESGVFLSRQLPKGICLDAYVGKDGVPFKYPGAYTQMFGDYVVVKRRPQ